ncbi:hypothetical protein N7539_006122 [Penicillium diatomitis]|uniref:Uncharacterized protein n=1 Tax=Penicillium diatomitis TaxID=2819901 RepID=A0A9W9X2G1_9EURO|nr:uncharacterized protein N7539_006122 [Penicillium diatomitis]KAJ5482676.1 hypothetical protein N7539_006122 [Penicillium diatomitis]
MSMTVPGSTMKTKRHGCYSYFALLRVTDPRSRSVSGAATACSAVERSESIFVLATTKAEGFSFEPIVIKSPRQPS